jgi:hypothetical protein
VIAVQLTGSDLSLRQASKHSTAAPERESEHSGILPADKPATLTTQFQPLDPSIVSEAIPAFFIGRNKEGFWVARDVKGQIGGIFLLQNSARSFAKKHCQPAGCATIFPSESFELDLENKGNPFAVQLGSLTRLATRYRQRMAAVTVKTMEAVKRRLKGFHVL